MCDVTHMKWDDLSSPLAPLTLPPLRPSPPSLPMKAYMTPLNGVCSFYCVWRQCIADPSWLSHNIDRIIHNYILTLCDFCIPFPGTLVAHALRLPHWCCWVGAVYQWMRAHIYEYYYTCAYMNILTNVCIYKCSYEHIFIWAHIHTWAHIH